jgi:hypothetical protein
MKIVRLWILLAAILPIVAAEAAVSRSGTIEGRIYEYVCGDNCYLTIVDKFGSKHTGLCTARECNAWNDAAELPREYIGERVAVTLGIGVQLDGNGDVIGHTTAFKSVRFVDRDVAAREIYNYSCKVDGKTYPLRVDGNKNVLEWRGKRYSLTITSADEPDGCAKNGWHAKGNGTSFTFCTATQGYAAIEDKDGNDQVQCNLIRPKLDKLEKGK